MQSILNNPKYGPRSELGTERLLHLKQMELSEFRHQYVHLSEIWPSASDAIWHG